MGLEIAGRRLTKWTKNIVESVFNVIIDAILVAEPVNIKNFGTFSIRLRKGRKLYSRYAGGYKFSKDTWQVKFKAGTRWKKSLQWSA
jgi:nucleoid DNA-binding protein